MGNQVSSNLKHALLVETSNSKKSNKKQEHKEIAGILSFEVANVMSKIVQFHKSVADKEISKVKNEIMKFNGVKALVSPDETCILEFALEEKVDDLNRVTAVVARV